MLQAVRPVLACIVGVEPTLRLRKDARAVEWFDSGRR